MYNEIITHYSKTPPNKGVLDTYDISFWEENRTCGDDLKVYIKIWSQQGVETPCSDDIIEKWSFQGDTAIITTACASIFWESIVGMRIDEVLSFGYTYIEELIAMPVSPRRKQASVLGLLTTRNALHQYLQDGKHDSFDDVLLI